LKSKIRKVDKETWRKLISETLFNIHYILESVQVLLDHDIKKRKEFPGDHPHVAAGLYTYAIEEFGKYLYLRSLTSNDNNYEIDYFVEFRNHSKKFKRSLTHLPSECKLVHSGDFSNTDYVQSGFNTDIIADFETRKNIFYSDFEDNQIQELPNADVELLQIGVNKLLGITEDELEKFNKEKSV